MVSSISFAGMEAGGKSEAQAEVVTPAGAGGMARGRLYREDRESEAVANRYRDRAATHDGSAGGGTASDWGTTSAHGTGGTPRKTERDTAAAARKTESNQLQASPGRAVRDRRRASAAILTAQRVHTWAANPPLHAAPDCCVD